MVLLLNTCPLQPCGCAFLLVQNLAYVLKSFLGSPRHSSGGLHSYVYRLYLPDSWVLQSFWTLPYFAGTSPCSLSIWVMIPDYMMQTTPSNLPSGEFPLDAWSPCLPEESSQPSQSRQVLLILNLQHWASLEVLWKDVFTKTHKFNYSFPCDHWVLTHLTLP